MEALFSNIKLTKEQREKYIRVLSNHPLYRGKGQKYYENMDDATLKITYIQIPKPYIKKYTKGYGRFY